MVNGQWSMVNGQWSKKEQQITSYITNQNLLFTIHYSRRLTITNIHQLYSRLISFPFINFKLRQRFYQRR